MVGAALGSDYNVTRGHVGFGLGVVECPKSFCSWDSVDWVAPGGVVPTEMCSFGTRGGSSAWVLVIKFIAYVMQGRSTTVTAS